MNNLIRPQQFAPPAPTPQDGQWIWDGTQWICGPGCGPPPSMPCPPPFPCPPPGWPPPGCPPWFSGQNSPPWYPGANAGISFGQTPPANPVRGHMFYDGKTLWLFDGASWDPIGGEAAVAPTPPSSNPPPNPVPGTQWFNGTTLYVWDGNAWVPVSQTKTSIQATAPTNPNPGDLWFDGQQMRIWSGSAWMLVGPGATVGPVPTTTQVFGMAQATSLSISGTAWSVVPFTASVPQVDPQGMYDPVTHKLTPKVPGVYQWIARTAGGGTADTFGILIIKNDTGSFVSQQVEDVIMLTDIGGGPSVGGWLQGVGMCKMNGTTDFVRLFAYDTNGTFYGAGQNQVFQGWLMP